VSERGGYVRYLLLIHGEEAAWEAAPEADRAEMYEAYGKVFAQMQEHGHLIEADELRSASTSKLVRVRDGETSIVDGPYAETKEQLGGYFLVDCDLETALAYAAAIPGSRTGAIEVRPAVPPESS
jgi:hypothetical protein